MKRIVALILALVCIFSLAACAKKDDKDVSGEGTKDTTGDVTTAATDSDKAYITDKGSMIIGITYYEPMNYLDDKGELTGFETEFAKAVCEKLGVEAKFQEINWKTKEIELNAKTIDCIWNGMTITDERKETMSVTEPYMNNKQVLVVRADKAKDLTSVDGLTIVAEAESAGEKVAQKDEFFKNANYIAVDTQSKALFEVKSGTADACVVDYVCSIGMIGEGTDYADLAVVESLAFNDEQYGAAFRKGSDMTAAVNEAIAELVESGKVDEIAAKYKLAEQVVKNEK